MRCHECKHLITKHDQAKMKVEKNEAGQIVAGFHHKCWYVRDKHTRMGEGGRYLKESPTVYEEAARYRNRDDLSAEEAAKLAARQAEIAEETAKEPRPTREDDWRDPLELDLEDVIAEASDG